MPPNSEAPVKSRDVVLLLLLFVYGRRRRRRTWCFHVVVSVYGGTTWHRGVRSAAARQGDAERSSPPPPPPRTVRRRRRRLLRSSLLYRILHAPHTRVEPDWHHVSTRRPTVVVPPHHRSSGPHATTRHVVPATRSPPFIFACPPFDFPLSSRCACACVCGRRRRRTRSARCARPGGTASEQRLAVCPFGTPPGGATRRPAPQHRRRACRSVAGKPERSHIFRYSAVLYYIYIYI